MAYVNKHSSRIDEVIESVKNDDTYNMPIPAGVSNEQIVKTYSNHHFTNLNKQVASQTYKKKCKCEDCGGAAENGCHGKGEERPVLLMIVLKIIRPDINKEILLKTLVIEYLKYHKQTHYAMKCVSCHKKERMKGITNMNKGQLIEYCNELGISLSGKEIKKDLINIINVYRSTQE